MKGKKKIQQPIQKPLANKLRLLKTNDGKDYKILDNLLIRYSALIKGLIQQDKDDQQISLTEVDSQTFDYIYQFMQLHREKEPSKIHLPLKSNQGLKYIMEQADAELIDRIMERGDHLLKKVLDAAQYLQIQDFKKRIIAGIAMKFIGSTVDQLKQQYKIGLNNDLNEDQLKEQIKQVLTILKKMDDQ